jgi:hypothetical protein
MGRVELMRGRPPMRVQRAAFRPTTVAARAAGVPAPARAPQPVWAPTCISLVPRCVFLTSALKSSSRSAYAARQKGSERRTCSTNLAPSLTACGAARREGQGGRPWGTGAARHRKATPRLTAARPPTLTPFLALPCAPGPARGRPQAPAHLAQQAHAVLVDLGQLHQLPKGLGRPQEARHHLVHLGGVRSGGALRDKRLVGTRPCHKMVAGPAHA